MFNYVHSKSNLLIQIQQWIHVKLYIVEQSWLSVISEDYKEEQSRAQPDNTNTNDLHYLVGYVPLRYYEIALKSLSGELLRNKDCWERKNYSSLGTWKLGGDSCLNGCPHTHVNRGRMKHSQEVINNNIWW